MIHCTDRRKEILRLSAEGEMSNCCCHYRPSSPKSHNTRHEIPPDKMNDSTESIDHCLGYGANTDSSRKVQPKQLQDNPQNKHILTSETNVSCNVGETSNHQCFYQGTYDKSLFSRPTSTGLKRASSFPNISSSSRTSLLKSSPPTSTSVKPSPHSSFLPSPKFTASSAKLQVNNHSSFQKTQLDFPLQTQNCASTISQDSFGTLSQNLTPSTSRRVLIIGAGCSGLAAIKSCLDEGLQPVCLERSSDIGGLWNYKDNDVPGNAGIYRSLVINTSKEMMMFSDFPPPESFPHFLTHEKVLEYFRLYADHFGLLRYIRFGAVVKRVSKAEDYNETGRWKVDYVWSRRTRARSRGISTDEPYNSSDTESDCPPTLDSPVQEIFDGVMVCTGHHSVPYIPHIPGLDDFRGQVLHSRFYKEPAPFRGKRVVILGMGNSAVDIACDLSKTAKEVYLCSRRGCWVVPRTSFWGLPADMLANSRVVFTLPYRLLDWIVQVQANCRVDHDGYGIRPQHGVLNSHPTINDELPIHLVSGRVQTRPAITHVRPDGVIFQRGEFLACDVIVLATGYDYRVDFVDQDVLKVENNQSHLYKFMLPPHLPHPTLTVIGLIQAIGAAMPISEIQTRWAAKLITGEVKLPSRDEMEEDYRDRKFAMEKLYVESRRHSMQTFWIDYMDQIASKIDAKPNLWKMLFKDPGLALKCYLGPCLPAQYRLVGDHTWPKAREFILGVFARTYRSKVKQLHKSQSFPNGVPALDRPTPTTHKPTSYSPGQRNSNSCTNDTAVCGACSIANGNDAKKACKIIEAPTPRSYRPTSHGSGTTKTDSHTNDNWAVCGACSVPNGNDPKRACYNDEATGPNGDGNTFVKSETRNSSFQPAVSNALQKATKDCDSLCNQKIHTSGAQSHDQVSSTDLVKVTQNSMKRPWSRPSTSTSALSFTFYLWAILVCCIAALGVSHMIGQLGEFLIG